jgi:hypothetical protein
MLELASGESAYGRRGNQEGSLETSVAYDGARVGCAAGHTR